MEIFKKYKAVWLFLLKFFGVYIISVLIYNHYLADFTSSIDGVTRYITEQVASLFSLTLPEISTFYSCENPIAEVRYVGVSLILLTEGCNALSIMILFFSFLVAFTGPLKNYLWFVPMGFLILYIANIIRIYLIGMIVLYYPEYVNFAHDLLFPGIIYGTTFMLWVIWVNYYSNRIETI